MKQLIILAILLPALAFSVPGPATRYLMNDPASMLDVGLVRLDRRLERTSPATKGLYTRETKVPVISINFLTNYDYGDDIFNINISYTVEDTANAEDGCRYVLRIINANTGDLVAETFTHSSYSNGSAPANLVDELKARTLLHCSVTELETLRK